MDRKTMMWGIIIILLLGVLYLTFKSTGNVVAGQSAASATKTAAQSYSGMVGGC